MYFKLKIVSRENQAETIIPVEFASIEDCQNYVDQSKANGLWGDVNIYDLTIIDITAEVLAQKAIADKLAATPPISPRQIRMALLNQGLSESMIDTAIGTLSSPQKEQAMIAWKYSTTFKREESAVSAIGALLSLNSDQLDALWKAANIL